MTTQSQGQDTSKMTVGAKLAYGFGDVGASIVTAINGFFLNAFLLEVAGLRPAMVGTIFLLVKIWDAVNDPLIGALTDRTKSRWGRRRPWLLFGAIPFGLAFLLHWLVPPLSDMGKFWYYLVVGILLDTGFTVVNVPYTALTPELAQDYDERTTLNSYRFGFSILGGVVAAALHPVIVGVIVENFGNVVLGNAVSAAIWTFFLISSSFVAFAFTRENYVAVDTQGPGFFEGLKIAFSNRAFLYVTTIYLLSWLCIQFVQSNLYLYARYWADVEDEFPFLVMGVQLSTFVFLLMWDAVSKRIGKKRVYYYGMAFWVLVSIGLFFVQPGQLALLLVMATLAGVGVSVAYLIPWSMLPDVVDLDELETGQRREGVFYGFFVFLQKLGVSLGLAVSDYVLDIVGYINPDVAGEVAIQPPAVQTALRVFISFVPAVILLVSIGVVYFYPITRERHAQIKAELAQRRGD